MTDTDDLTGEDTASSPCIGVCELTEDGTACRACGQTLQELMR